MIDGKAVAEEDERPILIGMRRSGMSNVLPPRKSLYDHRHPGGSMSSPRQLLSGSLAAILAAAVLWNAGSLRAPVNHRILAADGGMRWYRGNLHTHTLWSDGDDYPEMVAHWYKDHGYDFLLFTDHNTTQAAEKWIKPLESKGGQLALDKLRAKFPSGWIEERTTADGKLEVRLKRFDEVAARMMDPAFLLIQGEEISDQFEKKPIHMNVTNVKDPIPPMGGDSMYEVMQRNTDALVAQRERTGQPMLIHMNHPNFHYAITAEDLMRVRGENFFEVYNGHTSVNNSGDMVRPSTERIWDVILTRRIADLKLPLMYGLATDDGHSYHEIPSRNAEPGRGWIMVLAKDLSPGSLIEAMEQGNFYASSGVRLDRVTSSAERLEVRVDPDPNVDYVIDFIGTKRGFDPSSEEPVFPGGAPVHTTRTYSRDVGTVLRSVAGTRGVYDFAPDDLYVRARVTASRRHPNPSEWKEFERAWCQPVLGPAGRSDDSNGEAP